MPAKSSVDGIIEKLTQVSMDLKSMLAVHDQRLGQQEKTTDSISVYLEKRREEMDIKLKDVYDTMRAQDNGILEEISKLRSESSEAHKALTEKINKLERYVWMAIGGGIVGTYVVSLIANYFKVLGH